MCSSYTCYGHTEGGARYVVKTYTMAELNGRGFTTMLAADTHFEFGTDGTTTLCCHADELSHTLLVEYLEGIDL